VWMSIEEIARYVDANPSAVRAAIENRALEAVTTHPRNPGSWMVRRDEVDRWAATLPEADADRTQT